MPTNHAGEFQVSLVFTKYLAFIVQLNTNLPESQYFSYDDKSFLLSASLNLRLCLCYFHLQADLWLIYDVMPILLLQSYYLRNEGNSLHVHMDCKNKVLLHLTCLSNSQETILKVAVLKTIALFIYLFIIILYIFK